VVGKEDVETELPRKEEQEIVGARAVVVRLKVPVADPKDATGCENA